MAVADVTLRDEHRLRRLRDPARREAELARARARYEARLAAVPKSFNYPEALPVVQRREDLLEALRDNQVVVVAGETGSGKTTQLPKLLLELGRGVRGTIAHTQPRRIAARSVAERIASELGVELGGTVGYAVRFNDRSGQDTLVRLVTDGLLLAEVQHDRDLRRYDTIIVDEAHERSLNIDFLLGFLHRLLPRRPDLKLVITSATIDPGRFAEHFGGAPVVEVSGRTFPVEVRYAPPADETDPADAIADAVEELLSEGMGDTLVFLSGEREIRDTAEVLQGRLGAGVDVLPLFSRLSSAEQQRIFRTGDGPRVVLATNVAETSLTVPGIRSVVDPGLARMSRYSARLKVQRLPIEEVSQASANQRAGRCGRVAPGVCVRLYAEDDLEARPEFTDPEILRTNLASVILQMAALGLGEVEDFPFLDPPDRRQVRDGVLLLQELGALDEDGGLTEVGRRLARLPVDPRLGRMVLAADAEGCATEVCVLAAALSIQDPRERPAEHKGAADQAHARFKDETSDFGSLLALWRWVDERRRAQSGNQWRKELKASYLHVLRVREWQDLVGQLRSAAKDAGVRFNDVPAEPDAVHRAMLSGLLSHVGLHDKGRREYAGARGARFVLWPGSALSRKQPPWVMVAELVETSRLYGRVAARVDPSWLETAGAHLVKRSFSEARWDRRKATAVATERVTLYGLPVVAGRTVPLGPIDPVTAREIFIRSALVEREWDTGHEFFRRNGELLEEVRALEERQRRRDLLATDATLEAWFDERVPQDVVSGRHFDRWWKGARRADPSLLDFTEDLLLAGDVDDGGRPATWGQDGLELQLSYRFEPGSPRDGVTVHVPLQAIGRLQAEPFEWLVPALREELVTALLRSLPKELRVPLVPIPETAAKVLAALRPRQAPLLAELARVVPGAEPADFDRSKLPPHLRPFFRVEDERGAVVAEGPSLDELRARLQGRLQRALTDAASSLERHGLREWPMDVLPRAVALPGTGGAVRSHPAIVDEGDAVGVVMQSSPGAQAQAMRAGVRRLLLLTVPVPLDRVRRGLPTAAGLTLVGAPPSVLDDAVAATVDALVKDGGGLPWTREDWEALRAHVAAGLPAALDRTVRRVVAVLEARRAVDRALDELRGPDWDEVRRDVAAQLGRLTFDGFVRAFGPGRLADVERWLRAAEHRLARVRDAPGVDRERMRVVQELEAHHRRVLDAWPAGRPRPKALRDVRWMLEELRVASFAQGLGVRGQVSAKRIRRALDEAVAAAA